MTSLVIINCFHGRTITTLQCYAEVRIQLLGEIWREKALSTIFVNNYKIFAIYSSIALKIVFLMCS